MNIAFGALVILFLLFPGISFRMSYLNGPYSKRNISSSFVDELFFSLIPAFIFQMLGYIVIEYVFCIDVDIQQVYKLITGPSSSYSDELNYVLLEESLIRFFMYTLCLVVLAVLAGKFARWIVRETGLDIRFHSLRFNNDWYYLFSGRILDFPGIEGDSKDIDLIQVDVLSESSEGTYIYSGILHGFYLQKDGIDRIYLKDVYRRKLSEDMPYTEILSGEAWLEKEFDRRYYRMPGDLFVIPYSQIRNLNVTYYKSIVE